MALTTKTSPRCRSYIARRKAVFLPPSAPSFCRCVVLSPRTRGHNRQPVPLAERKKDAVKKTLDAVGKTPPSMTKVGMDSDKAGGSLTAKDVMNLSQDDFRKLPDDVLARMRGDEL